MLISNDKLNEILVKIVHVNKLFSNVLYAYIVFQKNICLSVETCNIRNKILTPVVGQMLISAYLMNYVIISFCIARGVWY